jgi:peptidoglycan/xylan/chitin deacetylase (PgdA/CDA1 family)
MTPRPGVRRLRRRLRPLKRAAIGPAGVLLGLALRASGRKLGIAIVYHRVGHRPGDPARELVPAQSTASLREQLAMLMRWYRVVPASELEERVARRWRFDRFCVAITFDDDWAGHSEVSLPLLAEAGVTATFFLSGATLERPYGFWYERVQEAFDRGLAERVFGDHADIHAVGATVEALPSAERHRLVARIDGLLGPPSGGLRADAVRRMSEAGHEIGFHTLTHDTLTTLGEAELHAAMRDGRGELEAISGRPIDAIAYPSGKAGEEVFAAARDAGFKRGYTTQPDPICPGGAPLMQGRLDGALHSAASLHLALGRALLRKSRTRASS